jgi:hypothetical protein
MTYPSSILPFCLYDWVMEQKQSFNQSWPLIFCFLYSTSICLSWPLKDPTGLEATSSNLTQKCWCRHIVSFGWLSTCLDRKQKYFFIQQFLRQLARPVAPRGLHWQNVENDVSTNVGSQKNILGNNRNWVTSRMGYWLNVFGIICRIG